MLHGEVIYEVESASASGPPERGFLGMMTWQEDAGALGTRYFNLK